MEIYLDNAATTKVRDIVIEKMNEVLCRDYGNPSSLHRMGFEAEKYIRESRTIIANSLKVEDKEIIFTSGGTEANNIALIGAAFANQRAGRHIITTSIEHSSVNEPLKFLEENGFKVDYVPVDKYGNIILDELLNLITDDTIMISMIYVNNEIGTIQKLSEIIPSIKQKKENVIIHVDAIQSFGKINVYPKRENIDLLSISSHKIHGPKGVGALYMNKKVKINPIIFGGGQEFNMRSGTENVPGIAGFGQAVLVAFDDLEMRSEYLYHLKKIFIQQMIELEGVTINGIHIDSDNIHDALRNTAPHIVSVSFKDVRSEVFLHALADIGIYVSAGSACSSNQPQHSRTLIAIGLEQSLLSSTIRFSFADNNTEEEMNQTINEIKKTLPILRRYKAK